MQNLFETKVKYEKIDDKSGKEKKVTEVYLLDAVSFGEAESRIYKEMESMIRGEFVVTNIRKAHYTEIFDNEEGDIWFKSKISFASVDEKSGKEKKVSNFILVLANDTKDAHDKIHEGMGGMTVDFEINSIIESSIVDFFPYFNGGLKAYHISYEDFIYTVAAQDEKIAATTLEAALEEPMGDLYPVEVPKHQYSTMFLLDDENEDKLSLGEMMKDIKEACLIGTTD